MDTKMILDVLYIVVMILLGGLVLWLKGSGTVKGMAAALITQAEYMYKDATKAGGVKFAWVVAQLCARLPFLSEKSATALVQTVFDAVEAYAKLQLDKAAGKIEEKIDDPGDRRFEAQRQD